MGLVRSRVAVSRLNPGRNIEQGEFSMSDPGLPDGPQVPDLPDTTESEPPGGDPGSVPETPPQEPEHGHAPDASYDDKLHRIAEEGLVETSDQLPEAQKAHDASAQEEDQQPGHSDETATPTPPVVMSPGGAAVPAPSEPSET
jgi:hypothetical protein